MTAVPTFKGQPTGIVNDGTIAEIKIWQTNNYVAPLGYYKFAALESGGTLREDAAAAWDALAQKIARKGGTIAGPYGDTKRPLMKSIKVGASKFSFHYVGRAVDLNQSLERWKASVPYGAAMQLINFAGEAAKQ